MSCKLTLLDEVTFKLDGVPEPVRREIHRALKFENPAAKYMKTTRLYGWDGAITFFNMGGTGYIHHLDVVLSIMDKHNIQVTELVDKRVDHKLDLQPIDETYWADTVWPEHHAAAGEPIVLRDYQVDAVNNFLGTPQGIQQIPTAGGKTIILSTLSRVVEQYGRSIIIVPNRSLVTQTLEDYENCGLDTGVFYGGKRELDRTHTICTWQSLETISKAKKDTYGSKNADMDKLTHNVSAVIVDECFDGDTLITTPFGKTPIKNLKVGDKIINLCESSYQYKEDCIVKVHKNLLNSNSEKMLELVFENKSKTRVTANHKYLTNNGWVRADELTVDLMIMGNGMKLISKQEVEKSQETYNLHIEYDHNYIANDAVVANCHMAKATVLKRLLTQNFRHAPIRWGLTGTIPKEPHEFESLRATLGPVINTITPKTLQDAGYLSNCKIHIKQLIDFPAFKTYAEELSYLITNPPRVNYISSLIETVRETGNTLVLVDRLTTGKTLQGLINDSVFVSGTMKVEERKEHYDTIRNSSDRVIIATYQVAAVGINLVNIHHVVLVEPGKSFVRVIQSIGRGLRKSAEKDFVDIWDITSSCKFSKRHLTARKKFYKEAEYDFTVEKLDWN